MNIKSSDLLKIKSLISSPQLFFLRNLFLRRLHSSFNWNERLKFDLAPATPDFVFTLPSPQLTIATCRLHVPAWLHDLLDRLLEINRKKLIGYLDHRAGKPKTEFTCTKLY